MRQATPAKTVLFVCLHGSAKSLIAAEHFNRLAGARGLNVRAESSGIEPDDAVPPAVVAGLAASGIDVRSYVPRALADEQLEAASRVVSFGCDLPVAARGAASVAQWMDLPLVSEDFEKARDAIVRRVTELVDELHSVSAVRPPAANTVEKREAKGRG